MEDAVDVVSGRKIVSRSSDTTVKVGMIIDNNIFALTAYLASQYTACLAVAKVFQYEQITAKLVAAHEDAEPKLLAATKAKELDLAKRLQSELDSLTKKLQSELDLIDYVPPAGVSSASLRSRLFALQPKIEEHYGALCEQGDAVLQVQKSIVALLQASGGDAIPAPLPPPVPLPPVPTPALGVFGTEQHDIASLQGSMASTKEDETTTVLSKIAKKKDEFEDAVASKNEGGLSALPARCSGSAPAPPSSVPSRVNTKLLAKLLAKLQSVDIHESNKRKAQFKLSLASSKELVAKHNIDEIVNGGRSLETEEARRRLDKLRGNLTEAKEKAAAELAELELRLRSPRLS